MLYFAYGSNLNHRQMKHRCGGSKFIKKFTLKGYKLIFSHSNPKNKYGHANVQKKNGFNVLGCIWNISKKNEDNLDIYEDVPGYYQKEYFTLNGRKVLFYKQNKFIKRKPTSRYLHTIIEGYKDCKLDLSFLKKRITFYTLNYKIIW
tara:strand:+ start:582 stop:1022 length:441 start_codon:yes stop_codon:yes gene_type:complete